MAEWREATHDDRGKYAFIENLPWDAPPALLRTYRPLKFNVEDSTYSIDCKLPHVIERWTTAGWVALTSRVCVCERPEETP